MLFFNKKDEKKKQDYIALAILFIALVITLFVNNHNTKMKREYKSKLLACENALLHIWGDGILIYENGSAYHKSFADTYLLIDSVKVFNKKHFNQVKKNAGLLYNDAFDLLVLAAIERFIVKDTLIKSFELDRSSLSLDTSSYPFTANIKALHMSSTKPILDTSLIFTIYAKDRTDNDPLGLFLKY